MKQHSYKRDIILSLIVKLSLLSLIWWFCFSHPLDKNLQPNTISSHLFSTKIKNNNTDPINTDNATNYLVDNTISNSNNNGDAR